MASLPSQTQPDRPDRMDFFFAARLRKAAHS
jgi:hypothetical protein